MYSFHVSLEGVYSSYEHESGSSSASSCASGEPLATSLFLRLQLFRVVFVHIFRSSHPHTVSYNQRYYYIGMSHNGEASTGEATQPTLSSLKASELSEEQKQTVEKCTNIIQEFRSGSVSKSKAALLLQQAIPRNGSSEEQFLAVYEPYFDMLNNFERYRSRNADRIDDVRQRLAGFPAAERDSTSNRPVSPVVLESPVFCLFWHFFELEHCH